MVMEGSQPRLDALPGRAIAYPAVDPRSSMMPNGLKEERHRARSVDRLRDGSTLDRTWRVVEHVVNHH